METCLNEISELEHKATETEFWKDMGKSQVVLQKIKFLKNKVGIFQTLEASWEDLCVLNQLGIEENDEGWIT